jgi:hypothetical protein
MLEVGEVGSLSKTGRRGRWGIVCLYGMRMSTTVLLVEVWNHTRFYVVWREGATG